MFSVIISEKGGAERRETFDRTEINVGRVQGNDLMLPKGNVSKRHSRIVLKDGKFIIVDLKSTNGTYVNGRKITSPLVVKDSDKIYIGDFIVGVDEAANAEGDGASASPPEPTTGPPRPAVRARVGVGRRQCPLVSPSLTPGESMLLDGVVPNRAPFGNTPRRAVGPHARHKLNPAGNMQRPMVLASVGTLHKLRLPQPIVRHLPDRLRFRDRQSVG